MLIIYNVAMQLSENVFKHVRVLQLQQFIGQLTPKFSNFLCTIFHSGRIINIYKVFSKEFNCEDPKSYRNEF